MNTQSLARLITPLFVALAASCASTRSADPGQLPRVGRLDYDAGVAPSARTLRSTARVLADQGRDAECELVLKKLITDYPDFVDGYNELAELYLRNDQPEYALASLDAALEIAPDDVVLLNNVGMCHVVTGDHATALEWFERAVESDPYDVRSHANVAYALGMVGRMNDALASYMKILPEEDAHFNIGVLCETTGDHDRAAAAFEYAELLRRNRQESAGS